MFARIAHEIEGRIRFETGASFSDHEACALQYSLGTDNEIVNFVRVYRKTGSVTVRFKPEHRAEVIELFNSLSREDLAQMSIPVSSSMLFDENYYPEKIASMLLWRTARKILLPPPLRAAWAVYRAVPFFFEAAKSLMHGKLDVPVLDATAIAFSVAKRDFASAGSIIFLLKLGEVFQEWTERKSTADLVSSMLGADEYVWVVHEDEEIQVKIDEVQEGDTVVVRMGYAIPIDGTIIEGEGQVNQSSLTGESAAVHRSVGDSVFAGTTLEEGTLFIEARATSKETRLSRIMSMVDDASQQKSSVESRVEHMANSIVPYNMAFGSGVGLITRNLERTSAAFVVDYSCGLQLATSVSVLTAMKEGAQRGFTIKGGKQLEALALADTIVFDKTGTLTHATPQVTDVISFNGKHPDCILRQSACLEEHFPHPVARAIVNAALHKHLEHRENHAEVEYIVAHGIASSVEGKRVLIGSPHFIFEDEGVPMLDEARELLANEAGRSSVLFLAEGGELSGAIVLEDPLRENVADMIADLKKVGFAKTVMLTGDAEAAAAEAARISGVDEYKSQCLPEDKAQYIQELVAQGHKVVMVGDGINDSLALASATVGIAMSNGADVAREVADITLSTSDISSVIMLRLMAQKLFKRLDNNYAAILGINSVLLAGGVFGLMNAGLSALIHNGTTVVLGLACMRKLMDTKLSAHELLKQPREVSQSHKMTQRMAKRYNKHLLTEKTAV